MSLYLYNFNSNTFLMYIYRLLLLVFLLPIAAKAQDTTKKIPSYIANPKREFRGVWVATVENIDWPKSIKTPALQQKQQLADILTAHQKTGINAVMFQVRPAADAFYAKSREPWSRWLTGKQGQAPDPAFDPLDFAITEAHKRGIELHAWFNPYRATNDARYNLLSPNHITNTKPEWFFIYGGQKLFNPGLPEVREYIIKVILDVVDNYDIDGVHMDDYFYPYAIAGQKINDAAAYQKYGSEYNDIRDWRRDNVNKLIKMLTDSVHKHNPRIKFGISPFGVWANQSHNPEGSVTKGLETYYEQYADSRKWMKEGWLDYINPQLYRPIGDRLIDFEKTLSWWSDNTYNRHLYLGQAAYRINEHKLPAYQDPNEMPNEIKLVRKNPRAQGSVFFSSQSLSDNRLGFTDSLRLNYYKHPALPPVMLWLDSVAPNVPRNFTARAINRAVQLNWEAPLLANDKEGAYGYVIYRFEGIEKPDLGDPKNILHIQYSTEPFYVDTTAERGKSYSYIITAITPLVISNEERGELFS